jgi:hypothetical protein
MTQSETATDPNGQPPDPAAEISAHAGRYFRNARYIIVVGMIAVGLWFAHDGWINYPADNAKIAELERQQQDARDHKQDTEVSRLAAELKNHVKHSDTDLLIQKIIAVALPVVGLYYLVVSLYRSRGRIRLAGDVLYVPGRVPIAASQIVRIDDRAWDRKGISRIFYESADKSEASVKLDDFVYEHKPIRAIHDRLVELVGGVPVASDEEKDDAGDDDDAEQEPPV